jgi:dipeptidyl aminopeptidase/acylaminoacyl peptidase
MRTRLVLSLALLAAFGSVEAQQAPRTAAERTASSQNASATAPRAFRPSDWYRVATVGSPAMSPDGRLVAFTVTTVKEAENERHSEIWVVPTAGGEPVRYTSPSFSSTRPRFSHDGKLLYFTSQRTGTRGSTWALRMDQPSGEAFQPESEEPSGSMPRDRSFVVTTAGGGGGSGRGGGPGMPAEREEGEEGARTENPFARMEPMARPPYDAITRPLNPARFDGRHITDLRFKANNTGFIPSPSAPRPASRPSQIQIDRLDGSPRKAITDAPYSHRNATVSPDGRWIAFIADAELRPDSIVQAERDSLAKLPYDAARERELWARNDSDIFIMPVAGGTPRRLNLPGTESGLSWSPDSRSLAFTSRGSRIENSRLYVVDPNSGAARNLVGDWQYEPGGFEWLTNGDIQFSANIGGRAALYQVSPRTGRMTEVIGGRRRVSSFTYDRNFSKVAYISTSVDRPTELYIADIDGRNERKLTSFNDRLNAEVAWSPAERFTYKSVGDLEIEGWLMQPYGYEPGKKYPVVLYIHGGPHSAYGEGWFDEFQNLAGAGMWVLFTNPRGSSGYGADFTYSTRGRWGMEDYEDLMKAVDIVAQRADVDSTRMGVTGGSYGGFMTAWITTKTDRFKAAQTDRMIVNWVSWYGTSDAQSLTEFEFYGAPWQNWALYDSLSPMKYVANVKTPTLIVQSEEDHRTPMADAEQWFVGLRKNDVPVEFVRYPRSTHDLSRTGEPWLLVDRLGRLRQWFAYYLLDEKPAGARVAAPN